MLRTGFNHTDHGSSVPPHPQTLVGHVSPLTFSPKYRAAPGISNAILAAFGFIIVFEAFRQEATRPIRNLQYGGTQIRCSG